MANGTCSSSDHSGIKKAFSIQPFKGNSTIVGTKGKITCRALLQIVNEIPSNV